jgi:hypothetical protein
MPRGMASPEPSEPSRLPLRPFRSKSLCRRGGCCGRRGSASRDPLQMGTPRLPRAAASKGGPRSDRYAVFCPSLLRFLLNNVTGQLIHVPIPHLMRRGLAQAGHILWVGMLARYANEAGEYSPGNPNWFFRQGEVLDSLARTAEWYKRDFVWADCSRSAGWAWPPAPYVAESGRVLIH